VRRFVRVKRLTELDKYISDDILSLRENKKLISIHLTWKEVKTISCWKSFKYAARNALFKDPVRTAL
jgi:hypothetical protein